MIREAIGQLVNGGDLSVEMARQAAAEIFAGEATPAQIGAFLAALRIRGESAEHIQAFAEMMRDKAARLRKPEGVVLDTCGTGGDETGTFNISTVAAIIAAGAGVVVAKHGNRAATSQCGSADVLEALGVKIDAAPQVAQRCLDGIGLCFMFARSHHAAMRHVAGPRQEIGVRTIFNLLGPLSNPAGATHQLIGVFDGELTQTYAEVLRALGSERALVVHGSDGLDELTTAGVTRLTELCEGEIHTSEYEPSQFGLKTSNSQDLLGGDAEQNASIILSILEDKESGPKMDIAILNAGAALYVAEKADSIAEGLDLARQTIASGAAMEKLEALRTETHIEGA